MTEAVEGDEKVKKKFNAVVLFEVDGERFELNAKASSSNSSSADDIDTAGIAAKDRSAAAAAPKSADLTVQTSLTILQELLQKKLTPQQAFLKGKIKIKGKMALAMKLQLILDATRKHLLALQNSRL